MNLLIFFLTQNPSSKSIILSDFFSFLLHGYFSFVHQNEAHICHFPAYKQAFERSYCKYLSSLPRRIDNHMQIGDLALPALQIILFFWSKN